MKRLLIALCCVGLSACAGRQHVEPPEPVIKTVEVKVPVAVPCVALAKLGNEPAYADTDEAIAAAPDIFEVSRLYAKGRLQRVQRLGQYAAARVACTF